MTNHEKMKPLMENLRQNFIFTENREIITQAQSDEVFDREAEKCLTYEDKVAIHYYSFINHYVKGHCWDNGKGRNIDTDGISKATYNFITTSSAHEHVKKDVLKLFLDGLKND